MQIKVVHKFHAQSGFQKTKGLLKLLKSNLKLVFTIMCTICRIMKTLPKVTNI